MASKLSIIYCVCISLVLSDELIAATSSITNRDAFITMLYKGSSVKDVGFEISVRVLGQSLRESKTVNEYVVLCVDDVPESTRRVLENDGWTVKSIERLFAHDRYNKHTTKVKLWLLEEYRRIVWLDADTIVVTNVDELFKCGKFCAVYRNSDQFNSGVLVVKPSKTEFDSIVKSFTDIDKKQLGHYRGDQQILNTYYENLKYATMFNASTELFHENPMRLPDGYNGDAVYYLHNSHWVVSNKIIHYTLGSMKPTQWWSYPLFDLNWKWNELRERLPSRHNEPSVWDLYNWIPLVVMTTVYILLGCFGRVLHRRLEKHLPKISRFAGHLTPSSWIATCFPLFAELFSYYLAFHNVPTLMPPKEAWFVYGMWVTLILFMTYIPYCYFLHLLGQLRMSFETKIEISMHLLLYILIYVLLIYIPLQIELFFQRLLAIILIGIIWFIYGYVAGRRILKLCYKLPILENEA